MSGATTKRPALTRCLKALRPGDTLIVWKLDRLGHSLRDLIVMLDELRAQGVKFRSLTEAIDTETPTGRAMWQMIGVLAELERSRGRGVQFGQKSKLTVQQQHHAGRLLDQGQTVREVAALFNVHRATLYRALAVVPSPTRVRTRV
jgi:DNA invertase Pin-like site-specific DNA recombinase